MLVRKNKNSTCLLRLNYLGRDVSPGLFYDHTIINSYLSNLTDSKKQLGIVKTTKLS